jgi:hypothetical protein
MYKDANVNNIYIILYVICATYMEFKKYFESTNDEMNFFIIEWKFRECWMEKMCKANKIMFV